jgi:hypothetical protein
MTAQHKQKHENCEGTRFYFILDGEETPPYNVPEGEAYRRLRKRFHLKVRDIKQLQRAGVLRPIRQELKVNKENGITLKRWVVVKNPRKPEALRLKIVQSKNLQCKLPK